MATIDNIRINGQQITGTPTIARLHPVITWDYSEDAAAPSQFSFDIRIGIINANQGSDSFLGTILDASVSNTANVYEYTDHNLERGRVYYGQVRAEDADGDITVWALFSFEINNLPFVSNFFITPSSPILTDDLELNYKYHDADNHDQAGTKIRWFRNNLPLPDFDDLCTLPSTATAPEESWSARIIPSDGLEFGAVVETAAVTIQDLEVSFDNVAILPQNPNVDDILKVEFDLAETEYSIPAGVIVIEWYLNGILIPNSNQVFIRPEMEPNDVIHVVVKLTDGDALIGKITSKEVIISDVLWHVFDLLVSGLTKPIDITDLEPFMEWKLHKTTALTNDKPNFLRVIVTKTQSIDGPIFDTGFVEYTKDSFQIPKGVLSRGQSYFVHVVAGDSTVIDTYLYN